jgi:hypothetical protein
LMLMAAPFEAAVAADWKLLVEQWLELAGGAVSNPTPLRQGGWSSHRYRHLLACAPDRGCPRCAVPRAAALTVHPARHARESAVRAKRPAPFRLRDRRRHTRRGVLVSRAIDLACAGARIGVPAGRLKFTILAS